MASVTGAGHSTVAIRHFERGLDHVVAQSEKLDATADPVF